VSAEVVAEIERAAARLAKLGAVVEEITLPDYDLFNACGRIIMYTEAYAIHEEDIRGGRSIRSADLSADDARRFRNRADIQQAMRLRRELSRAVNLQLKTYDALITASALIPAPAFADIDPHGTPELADPDHAVQRHRQPRDVDPTGSRRRACRCRCRSSAAPSMKAWCFASHRVRIRDGLSARRPALALG